MSALFRSLVILFSTVATANSLRAAEIAVLMSSDAAIYQEALQGFREAVPNRTVKVQLLTARSEERAEQLRIIRSFIEPEIVFVIGTSALQAVAGKMTHIPIVYSMVFNPEPDMITAGKNIRGVSMIPSPNQVMALIKELNPKIRRIGVMYDPARSVALYSQAQSAAHKERVQLIDRKIQSAWETAAALKSFENEIDLLWLWPDEKFLSNEILQRIFLFSFENKVPVVGLSERHTQMGALVSLSYGSAKDMGRQAGELVNRILSKTNAAVLPLVVPRQVTLTANLKTARKLDIQLPDSIIRRIDNAIKAPVYREGDWWMFRIRTIAYSGKIEENISRVTYKNGKFESEDPRLLTGGDIPGTPGFLPFATFHFTDPERKWLDFPLIPGKTWSFRYHRRRVSRLAPQAWSDANAEVSGQGLETVKTPKGTFAAIRIGRADTVDGPGYLSYFYSPQTKSVIKATAERESASDLHGMPEQTKYELELLDYGDRDSAASKRNGMPWQR